MKSIIRVVLAAVLFFASIGTTLACVNITAIGTGENSADWYSCDCKSPPELQAGKVWVARQPLIGRAKNGKSIFMLKATAPREVYVSLFKPAHGIDGTFDAQNTPKGTLTDKLLKLPGVVKVGKYDNYTLRVIHGEMYSDKEMFDAISDVLLKQK